MASAAKEWPMRRVWGHSRQKVAPLLLCRFHRFGLNPELWTLNFVP
jgi:hypothetical protein